MVWAELTDAEREQALRALVSAAPHAYRQQRAGKHEQVRLDGRIWEVDHRALVDKVRGLLLDREGGRHG